MTVEQMIDILSKMDRNKKVLIYSDDTCTLFDITNIEETHDDYTDEEVIGLFAE